MTDLTTPYLALQRLNKELYEQINQRNYTRAYEISIDMVDLAQQMEDITKGYLDAYRNKSN
jgi:hypothetical protein